MARSVLVLTVIFGITANVATASAAIEGSGAELPYSDAIRLEEYQVLAGSTAASEVSAPLMVALAYGLMWLAVVVFVGLTWRKGLWLRTELELATRRLAALEARVGRDEASADADGQEEDPR